LRSGRRSKRIEGGGRFGQEKGEGTMRRLLRAAAAAAVAMVVCGQALAQDYPTRTITVVVPYPPGGGVDAMAPVVAEKLSAALGQQVMVDNRAGGSGLVGTRAFIKSPPNGYTLFLGHTGSISINPSLYANAGFDPRKDFAPIGLMASTRARRRS
jgi:tripartite-type tricarboxylate transporter receptor subunit TctC